MPLCAISVDRGEQIWEQEAVDDESRGVGDLDRRLAERLAERAGAPAHVVAGLGAIGELDSSIRGTGLKTCSPTKRSGWPLACASSAIDSDEVVVARISSGPV